MKDFGGGISLASGLVVAIGFVLPSVRWAQPELPQARMFSHLTHGAVASAATPTPPRRIMPATAPKKNT